MNDTRLTRRALLRSGALVTLGAAAGCLGAPESPGSPTPTATPEQVPGSPGVTEPRLDVTGRECGEGANRASVAVLDDRVMIEGTIAGSDTCDTAALSGVSRREDGALTITVGAVRESDGTEACAQCITDIDYTATIPFDTPAPERVVVIHESLGETTTVITVTP